MTEDVLLRRSLDAIRSLRRQVEEARAAVREPIAVVGMGCRLPGGADGPEAFWRLLREGRDAITDVPRDRWPVDRYHSEDRHEPGTAYTRRGGFLREDVYAFDAPFFGISDTEAREMDPQQRLLLETSWEALEAGGLLTGRSDDRNVGVFVGVSGSESTMGSRPPEDAGPYSATGAAVSIAAGRVAYALGLRGPALAVDTACSSSLVAVHLAMQSLRRGECTAAVAGGVSAMMSPDVFVALCRMDALSADGRCKVFDESADGYVRSEGCGMVALMRLSDARARRMPVLAVIRGSAVNHDGRTSGLTVPNGRAQRELIASALAAADVHPHQIDYLEAHGTGTPLGDPIEVQAAAEALCRDRDPGTPLRIGAVKSNIGHLEAAAGVVGLIKTVLALRHEEIPANLHLNTLNPRLRADRLPMVFCGTAQPWPVRAGRPRLAGVSSFGFNGTNAHLVVQEPPAAATRLPPRDERPAHVLALSARDEQALARSAARLADWLDAHPTAALADVCHTVNAHRPDLARRAAFVTGSTAELTGRLRETSEGRDAARPTGPGTAARPSQAPVAFLLYAEGDRARRAAAELCATHPGFRTHFEECDRLLATTTGVSALDALPGTHDTDPLTADTLAVAYQIALVRLLADWNVRPDAVAGAGPGEIAAACLTGVCDIAGAGALLAARHTAAPPPAGLVLRAPRLRLLHGPAAATVTAQDATDPARWTRATRGAAPGTVVDVLAAHGYGTFVGLGEAARADGLGWEIPGEQVWREVLSGLAGHYLADGDVDWTAFGADFGRSVLELPTHPWQRRSYPPARHPHAAAAPVAATGTPEGELGLRLLPSPLEQRQFETTLARAVLPELADTAGVLHIGYYQEMLATAARRLRPDGQRGVLRLRGVDFQHALRLPDRQERVVQLVVSPSPDGDGPHFAVHSRPAAGSDWERHVHGRFGTDPAGDGADGAPPAPLTPQARERILQRCGAAVSGADFYRRMRERGVALGPSVEWMEEAWAGDGEVLARLRPARADDGRPGRPERALPVHPGVLDACVQLYALAAGDALADDDLFITARMAEVLMTSGHEAAGPMWVHVRLTTPVRGKRLVGDHLLCAEDGTLIGSAHGTEVQVISPERGAALLRAREGERWTGPHAGGRAGPPRADLLERPGELTRFLTGVAGELLSLPAGEVPVERPLTDLGLESLAALELRRRLRAELGVDVAVELLVDGPPLTELAERITGAAGMDARSDGRGQEPHDHGPDGELWLPRRPREDAPVRLFCLPYGGRGASLYRGWPTALDSGAQVCPVQLPGREERAGERPLLDAEEVVDTVARVLKPHLDRPFALYGHSMGGLLAYRLARRFCGEHGDLLRHLFVGAFSAPTAGPNPLDRRMMTVMRTLGFDGMPAQEELVRLQREQPGAYREALHAEFGDRVAAKLEAATDGCGYADLRIVQSYRHEETEPPLTVPVTAFHGADDPVVPRADMESWRGLTREGFELLVVPGDHFFLHPDQSGPAVVRAIDERLR